MVTYILYSRVGDVVVLPNREQVHRSVTFHLQPQHTSLHISLNITIHSEISQHVHKSEYESYYITIYHNITAGTQLNRVTAGADATACNAESLSGGKGRGGGGGGVIAALDDARDVLI